MIYYLTHIKDTIGNNYVGINIPKGVIDPFLNDLEDIIGEDDFKEYTKLQQDRDHGSHHITAINVMEYNALCKKMGMDKFVNSLDPIFKHEIDDLKMLGVGTGERSGNRTYFVVCQSDKLDDIRNRFELPKQDFHTTIGFRWKDVFGVPKNVVMEKKSKFLGFLKIEFNDSSNWDFIKKIPNFDLDPQAEVVPISLSETSLKIKCDGYCMDIGLTDDEKFRIMTKYKDDKDLPRLSETEISKIINK